MDSKTTKGMHINVSDELKKRFHATCVMQGKKMNQVVIELIQQWLETNELFSNDEAKELLATAVVPKKAGPKPRPNN